MKLSPSSILDASSLAARLHSGSVVLLPTDTLPALAVCPEHAAKLWSIKQRPLDKPLILMGAHAEELLKHVSPLALEDAWFMAKRYWPGALTLVLPAANELVAALNPGSETLGMRVPACRRTRDLLKQSGPLATSSANLAGAAPAENEEAATASFPLLPLLGPLPWPKPSGLASTVLAWQGEGCWQLLRHGAVIPEMVRYSCSG